MTYKADEPMLQEVNIEIQVPEDFPEKYLSALINAASKCKVKQHLFQPPEINVFTTKY
jgi:ribosomal protein S12 methylthiotransferase accessory factor